MNLFEAFGTISMKDEGFASGLSNASSKFASFTGSAAKGTIGFTNGIIKGMAVGGVAAVGFGVAAVKVGMDYEQSMAQVAATMGITADKGDADYSRLSKAAKDAGASTKFSAGEAAEGLNYLALAGFSSTEAVNTMPKVLNLAAAGNLDLAYASDLVTDSMTALGLGVEDVDSFVDQMAKTSQKSNTSVGQLGEGMLTVGGIAKGLSGGTVELSTSLGVLANAGIKGSEGGTKLRNVLLDLSNPTSKATKGLDDLGVATYDLDGNLRPLPEIFGDFNAAMGEMTTEEKREIIGKMFNKQDMAAVEAFLGTSPEQWDELSSAIENSEGTAKDMADTLQNTLKGSFDQLKSASSVFAIDFYENIDSPLKGGVQSVTSFVTNLRGEMNNMSAAVKDGTMTSGEAINQFADVFGEGLSAMVGKAIEYIPQMIEAAASFIKGFITGITSNIAGIANSASEIIQTFYGALYDIFPMLSTIGVEVITALIEGFIAHYAFVFTAGVELIAKLLEGITTKLPELIPQAQKAVMDIAQGLADNLPIILEAGIQIVMAIMNGLSETLPDLIPILVEGLLGLIDVIVANLPLFIDAAVALALALVQGLSEAAPELTAGVMLLVEAIISTLVSSAPQILLAAKKALEAIAEALTGVLANIQAGTDAIIEGLVSAISSWFSPILSAAQNAFLSIVDAVTSVVGSVTGAISGLFSSILATLSGWGSQISGIATQAFTTIVPAVTSVVGSVTGAISGLFSSISSAISAWASPITNVAKSSFMTIATAITSVVGSVVGALGSLFSSISSTISGWASQVFSLAKTIFSKIGEAVSSTLGSLSSALGGVWNTINSVLGGIPSKMLGLGKDIIQGLINGIGSMAGAVQDKVAGIASGITSKVKSMFEIFSPSRVMHELGGFVTEGFADGIEDEKDGLIKAADETFGGVFDVLDDFSKNGYNGNIGLNGQSNLSGIENNNNSLAGGGTGASVNVVQNIYAKPQSPAEILAEARRQQEMAVLMGV